MSAVKDATNFTQADIPSFFKAELKRAIQAAIVCGFTLHVSSDGQGVSLRSPKGEKTVHLSRRQSITPKRLAGIIARYGDSEALDTMLDATDEDANTLISAAVKAPDTIVVHSDEESSDSEPTVVRDWEPLLAARGKKSAYESGTTVVRQWSDGRKEYKCTECDYTSDLRMAPSRHFGNAHRRGQGKTPMPPSFLAEVPDRTHYAPRQNRIEALAALITEMMQAAGPDGVKPEEVAKLALTWVHEQSKDSTDLAAEREELTAEETLQRIRTLLDTGAYARLQSRAEEQERRAEAAEAQVQEALAQAARAREALRTYIDLGRELAEGDGAT